MSSCCTIHVRTHTGEKPYKCNLWQAAFVQKHNLEYHTRTDTGEEPYKCNLCQKAFAQKHHLEYHTRTHTEKKPYKCNLCHKAFRNKGNMKCHTRTHTGEKPYKCNLCHKAFAQKGSLDCHTRIHTGEKPYKCNLCHKAYAHKNGLEYHTRTHTGEKPYKCKLCSKAFALVVNLKMHLKSHTGEKLLKSELYHGITENCHLSTSGKRVSMYTKDDLCVDGKVLSTDEKLSDLSSRQCTDEKLCSENHSVIYVDIDDCISRPYGCGYCDEVFEIEKMFMDHCYNHYSDFSQKDTFLDLMIKNELRHNITENFHVSTAAVIVSMYAKDDHSVGGKILPKGEKVPDISSRQCINLSPGEKLCSENHSMINVDIDDFILRPFGCGYCDEVFEIENMFMDHCYNHYSDADLDCLETLSQSRDVSR